MHKRLLESQVLVPVDKPLCRQISATASVPTLLYQSLTADTLHATHGIFVRIALMRVLRVCALESRSLVVLYFLSLRDSHSCAILTDPLLPTWSVFITRHYLAPSMLL